MKHTNEPLLIQEILMSLYLELLDDYTIYGILEKKKENAVSGFWTCATIE